MTACAAIANALAQGQPLDDTQRSHLVTCPGCTALVTLDGHLVRAGESTRPLEPSAELRALLTAPVAPTSGFSVLRRAWAPVAGSTAVAAVILAVHPRRDLAGQSGPLFWAVALAWLVLSAVGVAVVLLRGRAGVGLPATVRLGAALAGFLLFETLGTLSTHGVPGSITDPALAGVGQHLHCALAGSAVALAVLALLLAVSRRSAPASPASAGLTAGVASGLAGVLALQCVCPVAVPLHVAVGHGAAIVVTAVVGSVVGRRVLSP